MHRGQIVEDGNHETLLARQGYYARLHRHQRASKQKAA
jgi:ABC-type multidrug transport system fused ATPase/permease subunit